MTDVAVDLGSLAGRTFAGVLFDMDGTLIDSTASVERCWATWAGEFDVALADLQGWHGVPALGVITHFVAPEFVEAADRRLRELEIGDARDIPMLAGGAESLAALADSGRVGIATSCTDDLALARFAASGLIPPPVVVTASQVAQGKPHPDPRRPGIGEGRGLRDPGGGHDHRARRARGDRQCRRGRTRPRLGALRRRRLRHPPPPGG